jgi:hypothetical protein
VKRGGGSDASASTSCLTIVGTATLCVWGVPIAPILWGVNVGVGLGGDPTNVATGSKSALGHGAAACEVTAASYGRTLFP